MALNPGMTVSAEIKTDSRRVIDYLLSPFKRSLHKELEQLVADGADAVVSIIAEGVEKAMTKYNRRAQGPNEEA